jgi:formamidopyrimidine-DNA glycosylase
VPELPEVETGKNGLAPDMEGAFITRLELRRANLRFPFPENLAQMVSGRKIEALSRRAKYLLIHLEGDTTLISHLGMSGSYRVVPDHTDPTHSKNEKHDHVILHLEKDTGNCRVIYNDPRRFGFLLITDTSQLSDHPLIRELGPEPTGNSLDATYLAGAFEGKKQPLKTALLDQKIIAGLGNIYVCEALHRSGLSPERPAQTLVTKSGKPTKRLGILSDAIRDVIQDAIASGGSSLKDHIQTDGSLGYFQHSFAVYDREGETCRTPDCNGQIKRIVQAGRSTFYCARCQK